MKKAGKAVLGTWRITDMEVWDADYFDMEAPAHITIRCDLTGEFQFGSAQGRIFIHLGDDSAFTAIRQDAEAKALSAILQHGLD